MKPGIDPKVDYAFKRLFGSEETKDILTHLLNAILAPPPGREVTGVVLRNPFNEKDVATDKLAVLDIKAQDASGRWFNVEMQMYAPPIYPQRALYYWAQLYTQQLREGQEFDQLCPAISITFLDSQRFKDDPFHHVFRLRDEGGIVLTEHLAIQFVELPKFVLTAEQLTTPRDVWCYFLRHGDELDSESLPKSLDIPPVRQAMEVLRIMSQNTSERDLYEARLKTRRDRAAEIAGSRQEGRQAGRQEGQLVGRILTYQEILKLPQTPETELHERTLEELTDLADRLKNQVDESLAK